ncbi:MAG: thioester dehydrase [Neisseria sp.]|nr:thioester dehydrase [Neisseria sp.]
MTANTAWKTERRFPITEVAPLLPHSGHMVLLDRVTACTPDSLSAEASVSDGHILLENGVLPCTMGMEIMAQGIGAFAGLRAEAAGEPVRLGYLLGTRKLNLFADHIPVGTKLVVDVRLSMEDSEGFGVFDCEMRWTDAPEAARAVLPPNGLLVQAALNVFSPKA